MRDLLEQQEMEKIEIQNENKSSFFLEYQKTRDSPENRQKDDINFFSDFCTNCLSCDVPKIQKAIRLGECPSQTYLIRRNRPPKNVLRDRTEKEEIFKSLKNLKLHIFPTEE